MQQRRSQIAPDPQMIGTVFFRIAILGLLLFTIESVPAGEHVFSVRADKCYLDGEEVKIIGLRCSNALLTDQTAEELASRLPIYHSYGVNAVSVYLMGSRFGNVKGYQPDATLSPIYAARMARIIEAADRHEMIVLVGCLKQGPKYKNGPKLNNYINIGIYTDAMKKGQCRQTSKDIEQFNGYMMASTWLQCVPPHGPNHKPGGDGSRERPGIKWWLEYVRDHHARAM